MNAAFKKSWEKQKKLLQDNVREEINFFKKPVSLEVIINGGLAALTALSNLYLEKLKANQIGSMQSIDAFIKGNPQAKIITKIALTNQNEDLLALLNACATAPITDDEVYQSMDINFEDSINSIKLDKINEMKDDVEFYLFCLYFLNYLVFLVIDTIKNSEIPSLHRTKYLQRLIKTYAAYMKQYMKKFGKEFKEIYEIIKSLATIDALIISIVGASYYYLSNRKKTQKDSLDSVNEVLAESSCKPTIPPPDDTLTSTSPIDTINIDDIDACDITDEDEVPTLPIIDEEVLCEVIEVVQEDISPTLVPNLITNAFIENKTNRSFNITVPVNMHVTSATKIAMLDASIIYAPVEGYVNKITNNKIYIRDISEYEESDLEKTTTKLVENYKNLFDIIEFIKKYNVSLVYPIMLVHPGKIIINKFLGIRSQHNYLIDQNQSNLDTYNKKIQDITKYDNIKPYLESNNVDEIKVKIDVETNNLLIGIKNINDKANDSQYNTIPTPSDYELFDYYMLLLSQLNTSPSITEIEKTLKLKLLDFTEKRYVMEKDKESSLKTLINEKAKDLEKGISVGNYFNKIYDVYKRNGAISDVASYLAGLALNNKKLKADQKDEMIRSIMYMFNFWLSTSDINKRYTSIKGTLADTLADESSWIKIFLDGQWARYEKINNENTTIETYLSDFSLIPGYGVKEEDGIKYRVYALSDDVNCDKNIDSIVKPDAREDLYTRKYWIKYLSYITLVGAADMLSWSTGLILPTGPVLLPVIYTPIIPIKTAYGFILIGLTICGVYVSPFITYNNMTLSAKSIVMPNIISFKDEIQAIKDEVNNIGVTLKNAVIKPILQNIKDELNPLKQQIVDIKTTIKEHNKNKPANGEKHKKEMINWNIQSVFNNKTYGELNAKKFKLQIKYKVLNDFQTTGKLNSTDTDASIEKVNSTVKSVNTKLDKLNSLIDKLDKLIAALPTALAPNSINFGATLKNPKLVIEIETDTNVNIDTNVLDNIFAKHKKSNEDLMKKNFKSRPNSNLQNYYKIIKTSMNLIVTNEPYPTYDRIAPTNLGFLKFGKTFVEKGAKAFGIPGQLPFP